MKNTLKNGFTLIELVISIAIFITLALATFVPYNYYMNKGKLRHTVKEISQVLYEARNMALNGATGSGTNLAIGVYFDNSEANKNIIKIYGYPHDYEFANFIDQGDWEIIKTISLQPGIEIDSVANHGNEFDKALFYYSAISGEGKYLAGDLTSLSDTIDISFSYKNSTSSQLQKTITYYTETNIVDY